MKEQMPINPFPNPVTPSIPIEDYDWSSYPSPHWNQEEFPKNPYPQEEYPHYFSLFQGKHAFLSQIYKENYHLGNAVRRLIKDGVAESARIPRKKGSPETIVWLKPL